MGRRRAGFIGGASVCDGSLSVTLGTLNGDKPNPDQKRRQLATLARRYREAGPLGQGKRGRPAPSERWKSSRSSEHFPRYSQDRIGRTTVARVARIGYLKVAMSQTDVKDLLRRAMALPPAERIGLATKLLETVEGPEDPAWEQAWTAELDRRAQAIDSGEMKCRPWSDVKTELLADLRKP